MLVCKDDFAWRRSLSRSRSGKFTDNNSLVGLFSFFRPACLGGRSVGTALLEVGSTQPTRGHVDSIEFGQFWILGRPRAPRKRAFHMYSEKVRDMRKLFGSRVRVFSPLRVTVQETLMNPEQMSRLVWSDMNWEPPDLPWYLAMWIDSASQTTRVQNEKFHTSDLKEKYCIGLFTNFVRPVFQRHFLNHLVFHNKTSSHYWSHLGLIFCQVWRNSIHFYFQCIWYRKMGDNRGFQFDSAAKNPHLKS